MLGGVPGIGGTGGASASILGNALDECEDLAEDGREGSDSASAMSSFFEMLLRLLRLFLRTALKTPPVLLAPETDDSESLLLFFKVGLFLGTNASFNFRPGDELRFSGVGMPSVLDFRGATLSSGGGSLEDGRDGVEPIWCVEIKGEECVKNPAWESRVAIWGRIELLSDIC
jgi:hypothetical protein